MTLIFQMVRRGYLILYCLWSRPQSPFWLFVIYWRSDCPTRKTENHWYSVDAHFKVLYSHLLLPSTIVEVIIWTLLLPFCPIRNQPVGKGTPRTILARESLILPKLIHLFEYGILQAIDFLMNIYPHGTAQYSPVIYLYVKFSLKQHKEPGENRLTHSVLLFLISLILPCFHCTDSHQLFFSLFHCLPWWLNQSRNIRCDTNNTVLWAFWSLKWLQGSMSDSLSASHLSLLLIGLSKSPIQWSQFSVSDMLFGALSSSLSGGWQSILLIRRIYYTCVRHPGMSFADKDRGNGDLSDNSKAATPSSWEFDQDALIISSVSEMYPMTVIYLCWARDSFCVAHRIWLLCLISEKSWTMAILCN